MATLPNEVIARLLFPYSGTLTPSLLDRLSTYLDLLVKWNGRTNLTAIRDPEEIVLRHFGESLFAGRYLGGAATLLDFGSGAGFPGLPIALLRPDLHVTLAESQHKKAAFLREACRTLGVSAVVWPQRVGEMASNELFDCVALRAVDGMAAALQDAACRAKREMLLLTSTSALPGLVCPESFVPLPVVEMPMSRERVLLRLARG